ncbi:MAG: serine hydrolase domain-containing protein [Bacteroidota bacterium]
MKRSLVLLLFTCFCLVTVQAQLTETQSFQIDSLFMSWSADNHPGGAVGIMQNGKVLYSKAFGLASLEYQVPNTEEMRFNIASISKQLTAMGIVVLHERGLLSIDDDIRKHLPDLPDFGHTITIRHMLQHASGLRSLHDLLALAGWREDDSRTNEDLYRFMLQQQDLNFIPGDEYLYCNTGYMLMVNIIESITEEAFPQWMKSTIFEPLGMPNTYVEDQYDRVVANNATSYYDRATGFFRAIEFWGYVGSGNVHSTTADMLNWLNNFSTPTPGWASAFELLQTTNPLNDGSENNYGFGVFMDAFQGYQKIQHGGAIGGFRSYATSYPEAQLSIAVLTNFSSSSPNSMEQNIATILLEPKPVLETEKTPQEKAQNEITYPLAQLTGKYEIQKGLVVNISIEEDSLHVIQEWDKSEYNVQNIGGNAYEIPNIAGISFTFSELQDEKTQLLTIYQNKIKYEASRLEEEDLSNVDLSEYAGRFYSPELESTLDILLKEDQLIGHHARHGDFPIELLKRNALMITNFAAIDIIRDENKSITGIKVSNGRARNVWFEKQK